MTNLRITFANSRTERGGEGTAPTKPWADKSSRALLAGKLYNLAQLVLVKYRPPSHEKCWPEAHAFACKMPKYTRNSIARILLNAIKTINTLHYIGTIYTQKFSPLSYDYVINIRYPIIMLFIIRTFHRNHRRLS